MRKLAFALPLIAALPVLAAAPLHHSAPPPKPVPPVALHPALVEPPPSASVCLNPRKDYDAGYLAGRTVLITAKDGKKPRPKLKADTNCIGIDGGVHIKLDSQGKCVAAGDALKLRRNGDYGWQTCQITQITPVTDAK
jgi:hypothetical protein